MTAKGSTEQKSPKAFFEELKSLIAANLAGNLQLVSRLNDLVKDATKAFAARRAGERTDASELLSRWLELNLASYSAVSTHSLALLNGIASAAEQALGAKAQPVPEPEPAPEQRVEMRLEGRQGERVTAPFLVENQYDRRLEVSFEASDLVPASGPAISGSQITFEPSTLTVAPKGQAVVQAAVMLTPDFVVRQTYATTIRMLGFQAKEIRLAVTVLPPAEGAKPAGQPVKGAKPGKKRRAR